MSNPTFSIVAPVSSTVFSVDAASGRRQHRPPSSWVAEGPAPWSGAELKALKHGPKIGIRAGLYQRPNGRRHGPARV